MLAVRAHPKRAQATLHVPDTAHALCLQVSIEELAEFCVDTALRSDWVQSQELSVLLLGRLIYLQVWVAPGCRLRGPALLLSFCPC